MPHVTPTRTNAIAMGVTLSFETQAEADAAHKAMEAKLIVPHIQ